MKHLIKTIYNVCPVFIKKLIVPSCFDVNRFIEQAASEIPRGSKVLDAGAGQCQYKKLFDRHEYITVDAACGDETWDYSQIDFVCDLESMPFSDNEFDCIICTQVLEHVKEPQLVVNEAYRVLRPGGSIYLSAPQGWGVHQAPHDFFRFTCYALEYLFEKAGFKVVYIKPSCGYFGYLANRLTILPKVLFWQIRNIWLRVVLFPLELLSWLLFVILLPLVLNFIDVLDRKRDYTLNYFVKAAKPDG